MLKPTRIKMTTPASHLDYQKNHSLNVALSENKQAIAQTSKNPLIVLDVEKYTLSQQDIRRISHPLVAGVILFARNFSSRTQLMQLCKSIKNHAPNAVIFVDHEGGRVQRFKTDGFTHLAPMYHLQRIYQQNPSLACELAQHMGYVLAAELLVCGVDMSYTPVLDLYHCDAEQNVLSKVIGDRAFASCPQQTTVLANRLIAGLKQAGMAACGKHFPGHGYASEDSHFDIARDNREFDQIMAQDVYPYQALGNLLESIMPAHVIYEKVDSMPAGFSEFWLQKILRQQLHYKGYIFSDDLSMEGASIAGKNVVDRANNALAAGCDGVIICNRPDLSDALLEGLNSLKHFSAKTAERHERLLFKPAKQTDFTVYDWQSLQENQHYINAYQMLKAENLILN